MKTLVKLSIEALLLFGLATAVMAGTLSVDFNDGTFGPLVRSYGPTDAPPGDTNYTVVVVNGQAQYVAPASAAGNPPTAPMTGFLDLPNTGGGTLTPIAGDLAVQWTFVNVSELLALGGGSATGVSISGCYIRGGLNHWTGGQFGDYWFGFVRSGTQRLSVIRQGNSNLITESFTATNRVTYRVEKRADTNGLSRVFRLYARYDDGAWHQVGADTNGDGAPDVDAFVALSLNGATPGASDAVAVTHVRMLDSARAAMSVTADDFLWEGPELRAPVPDGIVQTGGTTLGTAGPANRPIVCNLAWNNSWRESAAGRMNWDAVWIFAKYRDLGIAGDAWHHATFSTNAADYAVAANNGVPATFAPVPDGKGVFACRHDDGRGAIDWRGVSLPWSYSSDGKSGSANVLVRVFALPMVRVPGGAFYAGDGSPTSNGRFLTGGGNNPFLVTATPVLLSTNAGGLWADRTLTPLPSGGNGPDPWEDTAQGVTLSTNFPTGYRPFYAMRFEITQGQYADFLNTLTAVQATARAPALADFTAASPQRNDRYRCTLPLTVGAYTACAPGWAMNFLSWEDGIAFADWAGLRPTTELEFEKAIRGRAVSVAGEYAWGSTNIVAVRGFTNAPDGSGFETASPTNANTSYSPSTSDRPLLGPYRAGLFASKATREWRGESYWGISDLSGNVVEMAVTPARAVGRAFTGEHGDGSIGSDGRADGVPSWPRITLGFSGAFSATFGFGFRGGDFYNPELDLRASARNVATFGGARRLFGLGFRAARSAPDADPPLRISGIEPIGGQVSITWPGGPGMRLQQTTNLTNPTWQDIPGTTGADSANLPPTNAAMFFRLLAP